MQTIVNSIITNYEIVESSNNFGQDTLVILHGWGRSLIEWLPIAQKLNSKYKVVLLDLPGFGKTQQASQTFDTYDYAKFVEAFLDKLEIKNPVVLGHSFGGKILTIVASGDRDIKKLVLVDSSGVEIKSFKTQLVRFIANLVYPINKRLPRSVKIRIRRMFRSDDYASAGAMKETLAKIVDQDLTELLPKIKTETLVIWGSSDDVVPSETTKIYKKQIPNCKVRIVWGAKHNPHIEKLDNFIAILDECL